MEEKDTSWRAPRETTWENPTPLALPQSRTVVNRLSDWDTKATRPGVTAVWAMVALSLTWGAMTPILCGPMMRISPDAARKAPRATRSSAGDRPAKMLPSKMAALAPRRESSSRLAMVLSKGRLSTARSGVRGRSSTFL